MAEANSRPNSRIAKDPQTYPPPPPLHSTTPQDPHEATARDLNIPCGENYG